MKDYETIIFDLDGTLVHSAPDLQAATNVALAKLGRAPLDLSTVTSFIGNGVDKLLERSLAATGDVSNDLQRHALEVFLDYYNSNMTVYTRPYDGVVQCLDALKADGVKMGICTNKPTGPAQAVCEQLGLDHYFLSVIGADPLYPKKPDATPLLNCIKSMNCIPERTLYVGDSAIDYETALNANVAFRLFSGGYLNSTLPDLPVIDRFDDWSVGAF